MNDYKAAFQTLNIPVAENAFERAPTSRPFLIFLNDQSTINADGKPQYVSETITVYLYTEGISTTLEGQLETLIIGYSSGFVKTRSWDDSVRSTCTVYVFYNLEKL